MGLVLASCASLQLGGAVATHVFPHAGPWGVTTIRLLAAGLLLVLIARPAVRAWSREQWLAVG
ncbi:MAG TPA: EamA family transporter, partial [Corynebacterium sp.]|nr:EamA family transporter [Corynebacterium sp.]